MYSVFEYFLAEKIRGFITMNLLWRDIIFRSLENWVVMIGKKLDVSDVE